MMTYKRFALGPPGRPTGDRAPPLALNHNEWSGASPEDHVVSNLILGGLDKGRLHR
jgi:hypothetical protein